MTVSRAFDREVSGFVAGGRVCWDSLGLGWESGSRGFVGFASRSSRFLGSSGFHWLARSLVRDGSGKKSVNPASPPLLLVCASTNLWMVWTISNRPRTKDPHFLNQLERIRVLTPNTDLKTRDRQCLDLVETLLQPDADLRLEAR